jgi:hypothetical protein
METPFHFSGHWFSFGLIRIAAADEMSVLHIEIIILWHFIQIREAQSASFLAQTVQT